MYESSECPLCGQWAFAPSLYSGYYCYPKQGGCGLSSQVLIAVLKNGLLKYPVLSNEYLKKDILGYAHGLYIPYNSSYAGELTDLILTFKGSFRNPVRNAKSIAANIIQHDLDMIISEVDIYKQNRPIVVSVARSKPDEFWEEEALQFRQAISLALANSVATYPGTNNKWMLDGVFCIKRVKATKTTHLSRSGRDDFGPAPYPGITKDTCVLNGDINGKHIILVDDIYTHNVGVVEDCIQFLLDNGAADVLLYTLGLTIKPPKIRDPEFLSDEFDAEYC